MNFGNEIKAPCVNPNAQTGPVECGGVDNPPAEPSDCSDPIYAAQNPGKCLTAPRLIVKPGYSNLEVGSSVEFQAFLWADGVETLLQEGVEWSIASPSIAAINVIGHATALEPGIATVTARYGFMTESAQLEVIAVGECGANTYVLLVDNSRSMSLAFSGLYSTRLVAAKSLAAQFAQAVDLDKDKIAVVAFSSGGTTVIEESQTIEDITAAIASIAQSSEDTNIYEGLRVAQSVTATGRRVIVMLSDCEYKDGENPVDYARSIRGETVIIGVGIRSPYDGFKMLNAIANGGFMVNAKESNETTISDIVIGMQSYLCSGSCAPEGDVVVGIGALNYNRFTYWDVESGDVDLIGKNPEGLGMFDFIPGNGLYLDGCGSTASPTPNYGVLITKDYYAVEAGKDYTLTIRIAGNQREDRAPDVTRVEVIGPGDEVIATRDIEVNDYQQAFRDYTIEFTPTVDQAAGDGVKIRIQQLSIPDGGSQVYGNLWDQVTLENTTDEVTVFEDNFDAENPTYIDPLCGHGYYNYSDYYGYCPEGCLTTPIPGQSPDLSVTFDIENSVEVDNGTEPEVNPANIINIALNTATTDKTGAAAIGNADDFWNTLLVSTTDPGGDPNLVDWEPLTMKWANGESVRYSFQNYETGEIEFSDSVMTYGTGIAPGTSGDINQRVFSGTETTSHPDEMMKFNAIFAKSGSYQRAIQFSNLPRGTYDVYVYGHGTSDADALRVGLYTPLFTEPNSLRPVQETAEGEGWQGIFEEGENYVVFRDVTFAANEQTDIVIACKYPLGSEDSYISGIQLHRKA